MMHPIVEHLRHLGRRAVQLLWLRAVCRVLSVALGTALLLGAVDYGLRLRDPGLRWGLSLVFWGTVAWALWQWIRPLRNLRADPLTVARYVEHYYPQLNDQLASTVAFLQSPEEDPQAGSAQLRRLVIHEMEAKFRHLELNRVLQWRRLWGWLALAAATVAVAGALGTWQPRLVRLAALRLAVPWTRTPWPQRHHLRLVDPQDQIARGQPWRLVVEAAPGSRLPEEVWLHLRYPSGQEEQLPMRRVDHRMVYHKPQVRQPLQYRVTGGDDQSMPWRRLEVVDPPRVTSVVFTVHPPEYTGWKATRVERLSRVLAGSTLDLQGTSNVPLREAWLVLQEKNKQEIPLVLEAQGHRFRLAPHHRAKAQLNRSAQVTLRLVDRRGVEAVHRPPWQVRVVPDTPPRITLQEPQGSLLLTPQAVVPLSARVQDDLGVAQVALRYLASGQSEEGHRDQTLYRGPLPAEPAGPSLEQLRSPGPVEVKYQWKLAPLRLAPGTQLSWQLVARDYRPQEASTAPMRITIITPEQLHDHLAQQQQKILRHLSQVLHTQRQAREQAREAQVHLQQTRQLGSRELDHLKGAEVGQRQVGRLLGAKQGSLQELIRRYRWMLEINRLDHPEARRRMGALEQMVQRLKQGPLAASQRLLAFSVKQAQAALEKRADSSETAIPADEAPAEQIAQAVREQEKIIQALEHHLTQLTDWDNYRRFYRELGKLRQQFLELHQETRRTSQQTLGQSLSQLSGKHRARLTRLAQRQHQLARQFDTLRSRMQQMADQLAAKQPQSAQVLRDAADLARSRQLATRVRHAARHTQSNRMGQALGEQQHVLEQMAEMMDVLANRRPQQLARQLQNLQQTQQELRSLHQQQLRLAKRLRQLSHRGQSEQARQELRRLQRLQRQLAQQTQRLARQLRRLQAQRAGQQAQQAAQAMEQAAAASEGEQASREAQQAERKLADLQRRLRQQVSQLRRRLAEEQMAQLTDLLQALHQRQQEISRRTQRLHRQQSEESDPVLRLTLSQLAADQQLLAQELEQQLRKLEAARVFHQALQGAVDQMQTASVLLARGQSGPPTQEAQQQAQSRLAHVLQALKPPSHEDSSDPQQPAETGQAQGKPPHNRSSIAAVAQLRLLKLWQESLNARTEELRRRLEHQNQWTPELQRQLLLLQQEQGRLASLLLELAAAEDQAPEEDLPEELQLPLEDPEQQLPMPPSKPQLP